MSASLVIIAAGMGSRYGGVKQITPVGPYGEIIADYAVFDAVRAGFDRFVFVIREEIERDFREVFFDRIAERVNAEYVFQDMATLPAGRTKPWGTAHAVMAVNKTVNEPFMVIGADDFFGKSAFADIYNYITVNNGAYEYCMAGYLLKDTVSEQGSVSRAVCKTDANGFLTEIVETKKIFMSGNGFYSEGEDGTRKQLDGDTIVSVNAWGFQPSFLDEVTERFKRFLLDNGERLQTVEYFLPDIPGALVGEGRATVKVIPSKDKWFGFTYKEDKIIVENGIMDLIDKGVYPRNLWEG
jgi:hypothetical protein